MNCIQCGKHYDWNLGPRKDPEHDNDVFCSQLCEMQWEEEWEKKTGWDKIEVESAKR